MSGFGLRALKKVNNDESVLSKKKHFKNLVIGSDSIALAKFTQLYKQDGNIALLSAHVLSEKSIENEWNSQIAGIRSEEAFEKIRSNKPELELFPSGHECYFYKDSKIHNFNGRVKPYPLKDQEWYFAKPSYNWNWRSLFKEGVEASLSQMLPHFFHQFVASIELCEPEDLVEVANFKIMTQQNELFTCEKLYWCDSPKMFYQKLVNKDKLADSAHKYLASIEAFKTVSISLDCSSQIVETPGTYFLPQSQTHEWGNFIIDVQIFDPEKSIQQLKAFFYVDEDMIHTEEDLAKRIRHMKKTIERIFPNFTSCKYKEHIQFKEESCFEKIDDSLFEALRKDHSNLCFVGEGALIEALENGPKHQARAIISLI